MKDKLIIKDNTVKKIHALSLSSVSLGSLVETFSQKKHRIRLRAKGNSMFPFIMDGDSITITPYADTYLPEIGDVVAFVNFKTKQLIVHRLIRISNGSFETKGDNCSHRDPPQPLEGILGYVSNVPNKKIFLVIDPIKFKKQIAFFTRLGVTPFFGSIIKKMGKLL